MNSTDFQSGPDWIRTSGLRFRKVRLAGGTSTFRGRNGQESAGPDSPAHNQPTTESPRPRAPRNCAPVQALREKGATP